MRKFECREVAEAIAYAMTGGMALHVHTIIVDRQKAPRCFVQAVDRGEKIAHLFGQDKIQLFALVRRLGVNIVVIEREGTPKQHVDLMGGPLRKALAMCEREAISASEPNLFQMRPGQ